MAFLFTKTKDLIMKIDSYLDLTAQASMHFLAGIKLYLDGKIDEFEERLAVIKTIEHRADELRMDIEAQLYVQTLIPESRGDVLGILESMDIIINRAKSTMVEFSIEKPRIPDSLRESFLNLAEPVNSSVEAIVLSCRAYFYDTSAVKDHLYKVKFFEKESDNIAEKMKREIFEMDVDLSVKMHLRSFVYHIDLLADNAEEVSNRIAIATIKKTV
ncbi:MAG: DUF47 family protein [Spirochaetes bacterium]|jgi:hypothetical protein|nr:DUF47 family protein [Spirochaetota bacterium]